MTKRAKTLKTKGFSIESRNKFGKVVFRVSILKYDKYKKFRIQATPKGERKRIDRKCNSEEECYSFVHKNKRENSYHPTIVNGEKQEPRSRPNN